MKLEQHLQKFPSPIIREKIKPKTISSSKLPLESAHISIFSKEPNVCLATK